MGCCDGYCSKCWGVQTLVVGALVVANAYWAWFSWPMFIGALLVIAGAIRIMKPSCPCNEGMDMPAKKKK